MRRKNRRQKFIFKPHFQHGKAQHIEFSSKQVFLIFEVSIAYQKVQIEHNVCSMHVFSYLFIKVVNNWMDCKKEQLGQAGLIQTHSAFKPVLLKSAPVSELQAFCAQLLNSSTKITLIQSPNYMGTCHPLAQFLIDILFTLQQELSKDRVSSKFEGIQNISFELLEQVDEMLEAQLIQAPTKHSHEFFYTIVFQKDLLEIMKRCFFTAFSHHSSLNLIILDQILNTLYTPNYRQHFIPNIYVLLGGSFLKIEKKQFEQGLHFCVSKIGKSFTAKSSFITRNLKNVKKTKGVNQIVTSSMNYICNYQNKAFLDKQISKVSAALFGQDEFLDHEQFAEGLKKYQKHSMIGIVWLFLDLLRAQTLMIFDPDLQKKINSQIEVELNNFYCQEMQKLLKKCPYNGDQCCDCKKCHCVRRNRESAKLSQEKKRNAMEQLNPLKQKIETLQKRNQELEQENAILKGIFNELKGNAAFKSLFSATMEPISKVLHD